MKEYQLLDCAFAVRTGDNGRVTAANIDQINHSINQNFKADKHKRNPLKQIKLIFTSKHTSVVVLVLNAVQYFVKVFGPLDLSHIATNTFNVFY